MGLISCPVNSGERRETLCSLGLMTGTLKCLPEGRSPNSFCTGWPGQSWMVLALVPDCYTVIERAIPDLPQWSYLSISQGSSAFSYRMNWKSFHTSFNTQCFNCCCSTKCAALTIETGSCHCGRHWQMTSFAIYVWRPLGVISWSAQSVPEFSLRSAHRWCFETE